MNAANQREKFSDMDAEIAALERRREKAKQIKQFLTGRIRLPSVGRVSA